MQTIEEAEEADEECHPQELCVHCRVPLNFFASTIPYLNVFAEGWILRTGVTEPKSKMTVAGIWLIFLPYIGMGYVTSSAMFSTMHTTYGMDLYFFTASAGLMVIGMVAITRCTLNYLAWSKKTKHNSE